MVTEKELYTILKNLRVIDLKKLTKEFGVSSKGDKSSLIRSLISHG
jgi:hypothetical protein